MTPRSLLQYLDELLLPLGFNRQKHTWNRNSGEFVDVIEIQRQHSMAWVTVNYGIFHPVIYRACWDKPVPEFINEVICTVRTRAGWRENSKDLWWKQKSEELYLEVSKYVTLSILPFMEKTHTLGEIVNFLTTEFLIGRLDGSETVNLAAAAWLNGNLPQATEVLTELETKFGGGWWNHAVNAIERLRRESQGING